MKRRKLAALMIAAAVMATALPTSTFATPDNGDDTKEIALDENSQANVSIPAGCTVGAIFTVKLPSSIELSNTDGSWGYTGTVGVKGDIEAGKQVNVTPDATITVYDVTCRPTSDVPASADDQNYAHKDAKELTVVQEKQSWAQTELASDTYSDTSLTLTAGTQQSGVWRGTLNVNIDYAQAASAGGVTP